MFSNVASFALQKQMTDLNLKSTPFLRWQWKVTKNPTGGDFRKKDDQAAQLIFGFTDKQFIAYIWDPEAPVGSELMTTHGVLPVRKVYVIVVRSGDADVGKWVTETRNVVDDYKRAFKAEVPVGQKNGIRLQINSQHTVTQAESFWKFVELRSDNYEEMSRAEELILNR